ncbi:LOW QUALITY PROTEIN: probable xyloglucan endotransglucosylase/hydrolase protein 26 [Phalaenopsis equestris]|uniref:LOW QUALITY PROTEIN: probable xyloglucan endotransglucosylase/hydrolase protein 26 n=1 Tax=Phalaenopsis equestris TaxID=78828 RepID=UPI0009E1A2FF|nr:LOW QUALITY PROTEIN: probable xyloglucan endotransglucosylase/hydrolase protein 26 [Phalaenopsis equestris]
MHSRLQKVKELVQDRGGDDDDDDERAREDEEDQCVECSIKIGFSIFSDGTGFRQLLDDSPTIYRTSDPLLSKVDAANFFQDTFFNWGYQNSAIWGSGDNLALLLDRNSGSGIQTKNQFLFGSIEMQIKLVSGNSAKVKELVCAGTVTAYYMSSTGDQHDEIDFEFLGNVSGQPYTIHTNVFVNGVGQREQQFYPWFDPTADFHNYTIHWNPSQIVWFVDGIPIRVYRNYEKIGIPYPKSRAMKVYSSLWNADNWATRGGLVKIDWSSAPFIARYRELKLRACYWYGQGSTQYCSWNTPKNWWASPQYSKLGYAQLGQLEWVRNNYMIYDYCKDVYRFHGKMPLECFQPLL